jgi:hypothetical protein
MVVGPVPSPGAFFNSLLRRIKLQLPPLLKLLKGILKGFFNPAKG